MSAPLSRAFYGSQIVFDLYVLGDGALITQVSFMQTKYVCVLVQI